MPTPKGQAVRNRYAIEVTAVWDDGTSTNAWAEGKTRMGAFIAATILKSNTLAAAKVNGCKYVSISKETASISYPDEEQSPRSRRNS